MQDSQLPSERGDYVDLRVLNSALRLCFAKDDPVMLLLRRLLVHPVLLVGAGPGDPDLITVAGLKALQSCEVCLYDALSNEALLENLKEGALAINVGKRHRRHMAKQEEINQLILDYARAGQKVVRLKGGDPGFFGRVVEEVNELDSHQLPFRIIPGVSSLNAATTQTGLFLTRRGMSRGFVAMTPREAGCTSSRMPDEKEMSRFPRIFFMATRAIEEIAAKMMEEGWPGDTPVSLILNAGSPVRKVCTSSLNSVQDLKQHLGNSAPGLVMVGDCADSNYVLKDYSPLGGRNVIIKSQASRETRNEVARLGGTLQFSDNGLEDREQILISAAEYMVSRPKAEESL